MHKRKKDRVDEWYFHKIFHQKQKPRCWKQKKNIKKIILATTLKKIALMGFNHIITILKQKFNFNK